MIAAAKTCPICKRPTEPTLTPFCSQRCADADLRQWLSGGYAIPARPEDEEDDGELPPAPGATED